MICRHAPPSTAGLGDDPRPIHATPGWIQFYVITLYGMLMIAVRVFKLLEGALAIENMIIL